MLQQALLEGVDIGPLIGACCTVLERVGVLCQNQDLLNALASFGAIVDHGAQRVRFPARLTAEFIAAVRSEQEAKTVLDAAFAPPAPPLLGTQVAQVYYDYAAGARRGGNRQDLVTALKIGEALHGNQGVGHCLCLTEVPSPMESLESALLMAEYVHRPQPPFAWYVEQVDYLLEMGEIMGWKDWFTYGATCFAHPLRFDKDVADKFVRRVREGGGAGITAMPVAGMTTPVTVEGFTAVAAAEIVATWMGGRALNPTCPLGGSMWSATVDVRSGETSYSSPDALYYGFACCEFVRRWSGISLPVGGGDYCAAREPGLYAAMEKAWKAMTIAAFQGRHPSVGEGMLECGRTLCPVQLLIEREMALGHRHLAGRLAPTADRIGLASALEIDLGFVHNHLASDHTLDHFRELWAPALIDRRGWRGAPSDRELLDRAQGQVNELLNAYRKPEGRQDQLARLRAVVERARRALLR
jgi:trimethylamine:corrinoid methyltransferase-like protein